MIRVLPHQLHFPHLGDTKKILCGALAQFTRKRLSTLVSDYVLRSCYLQKSVVVADFIAFENRREIINREGSFRHVSPENKKTAAEEEAEKRMSLVGLLHARGYRKPTTKRDRKRLSPCSFKRHENAWMPMRRRLWNIILCLDEGRENGDAEHPRRRLRYHPRVCELRSSKNKKRRCTKRQRKILKQDVTA